MFEATNSSLEQGSLPQSVRHPLKESKAKETRRKERMIKKRSSLKSVSTLSCFFFSFKNFKLDQLTFFFSVVEQKANGIFMFWWQHTHTQVFGFKME